MGWNRHVGAALLSVSLAMASGTASAQDARSLFQAGQASYQQGNYEDAVSAFEQAYALDPRPGLQFNIAQAYGRLGRIEEERAALVRYVDGASAAGLAADDPQIVSARARIAAIGDRIARTGVELHGVPADGRVSIDGEAVTMEPGEPVRLAPGSHEVVVSVDGYEDFTATVSVRAGETLEVTVRLRRADDTDAGSTGGAPRSRVPAYVMLGVGGASMVGGTVLGLSAMSTARDAAPQSSEADSAKLRALGADIALFGGGALAVTGLVLLLLPDDESPAVTLVPMPTTRGGTLTLAGRF